MESSGVKDDYIAGCLDLHTRDGYPSIRHFWGYRPLVTFEEILEGFSDLKRRDISQALSLPIPLRFEPIPTKIVMTAWGDGLWDRSPESPFS